MNADIVADILVWSGVIFSAFGLAVSIWGVTIAIRENKKMSYHPDWDLNCAKCGHPKPMHHDGECDGSIDSLLPDKKEDECDCPEFVEK